MSSNKQTRQKRRSNTSRYQNRQAAQYRAFNRDQPTEKQLGRWKTLSWCTCGRPKCQMCGSPRRVKWNSKPEQLTMPERKAKESFDYELKMLYNSNLTEYIHGDTNEVTHKAT